MNIFKINFAILHFSVTIKITEGLRPKKFDSEHSDNFGNESCFGRSLVIKKAFEIIDRDDFISPSHIIGSKIFVGEIHFFAESFESFRTLFHVPDEGLGEYSDDIFGFFASFGDFSDFSGNSSTWDFYLLR